MNKDTYLKKLDRSLAHWMPEQELQDTLRWYEEYFEEAGPEREFQVMEELGSPEELARRLAEEGGWTAVSRRRCPRWVWAAAAGVLLAAVCCGAYIAARSSGDSVTPAPSAAQTRMPEPSVSLPVETVNAAPFAAQTPAPGETASVAAFTRLNANLDLGEVTVEQIGNEFKVDVTSSGTVNGEPYQVEYEVVGSQLKVNSVPRNIRTNGEGSISASATITIPAGWELDEVDISTGLGDIEVRNLNAEEIRLTTGLGEVAVYAGNIKDAELETGLGDVIFRGEPAETIELNSGMGDISVNLFCHAADGSYELSTGMGEVLVDGQDQGDSVERDASDEFYRLNASTGMGDIELNFHPNE